MAQKIKYQPENNGRKKNSLTLPEDKQYKVTAEDLNLIADSLEKKVDNKLVETIDWTWVAENDKPSLREILVHGDLAFITFADMSSVLGRITKLTNVATESIKITGFYYGLGGNVSLGNIELIPNGTTYTKNVDESKLGDFKTYTTANDFLTKAKDGEFGKYEKDGHMVIVYKNAGNEDQWITFSAIESYIGNQLTSSTAVVDNAVATVDTPDEVKNIITKLPTGLDNLNQLLELVLGLNNRLEGKILDAASSGGGVFRMAEVASFPDATDATEMLNLWKSVGGNDPVKNDFLEVSLEDWTKHALYHFDGSVWVKGTERDWHIKQGVVDMTGYTKTDALRLIFAQIGTMSELEVLLGGGAVVDDDKKTLTLDQIKILVENIKSGTQAEYAQFADDLFYKTQEVIEYRDRDTKLTSLDASVSTVGNVVRYSTLIKPLDRIYNEGSSFELTMNQDNMEVEYMFITHSKGLKFVGNTGDTYKWETILKNNVKYIKFTGTATLKITDTPLSTSAVWTDEALPFEIPMNEIIDDANNTAIIQMTFGALPALASKIAHIDYVTSLKYYEDRNSNFLKEILRREAYNYPTQLKETIKYEFNNNKKTLEYLFAGTNVKLFNAEVIVDETNGTTFTFKDVSPVKERLNKVNSSFVLTAAKACSFKYAHPTNAGKSIEISMGALSNVKFENISETQFKVSTDQTLKVDGHIVIPVPKSEAVLNFADYMDANGMMKISNHYADGIAIVYGDTIADLTFNTYDEFTTREIVNSINIIEKELSEKYVRKAYNQTPTFTHQSGFIVGAEGDLPTYDVGDQIIINLDGISTINSAPGAIGNSDVLFFGGNSVKQDSSGVETGLKWKTITNLAFGETNIVDNYLTKDLKIEKREGYYLLVEWVDKPKDFAHIDLANVSAADLQAALQRAGVDTNLLKHELVSAMGKDTTPTTRDDGSALQTGDWYIDSTGHTHMYAGGKFIVQSTATIDLSTYMKTADADAKFETKTGAAQTYETKSHAVATYQPKLTIAQNAFFTGVVYSQIDKDKVDNLPADTRGEFSKYQLALTSDMKMAIAKLFVTEADKNKYDGYDARINGKIGSDSNRIAHSSSSADAMIFRKTGEYSGQSYTYAGGSYVGAFNGASKLAVVKMDGNVPKLVGNDGTNNFDIPFGNILKKDLTNLDNNVLIQKLQAAGVQTQIFNEFKGVLATAPTGSHNDLDWYINDADFHLYVWHNNKWNSIGNTTTSVDKQTVINLLGITNSQLTVLQNTKEYTLGEKNKLANAITAHQDISGKANISYVDGELNKKANIGASYTKAESDGKYLTSHQDISGKADKTLNNVSTSDFAAKLQQAGINAGIFNEFKGVLGSAPGGTHQDLDWFISSSDNHLYLWHSNRWNNIGGGATASIDAAAIFNLLGTSGNVGKIPRINTHGSFTYVDYPTLNLDKSSILSTLQLTLSQFNKLIELSGKTLVQKTYVFDDNTSETHWGLK